MEGSLSLRSFGIVDLFVISLAGNAKILEAGIHSNAVSMNIGPYIVKIEIIGDVTIKFFVIIVPGIAFCRTPNLLGRYRVTPKGCDA